MFRAALICLLALPIVELWLLFQLADAIGFFPAVGLVVGTGMAGLLIARRQGLQAIADIRAQVRQGKLPAARLVDGALLILGAVLLIVPGVLTDVAGALMLIPAARRVIAFWGLSRFRFGQSVQIIRGVWQRGRPEKPVSPAVRDRITQ